tara:strand:- start:47 stop:532 length:486 start_codon:yes stop_codon:yes gene_type:complete
MRFSVRRFDSLICFLIVFSLFSGCAGRGKQVTWAKVEKKWRDITPDPRYKQVSPEMEHEMEILMQKGCKKERKLYDSDTAYLYSLIPGGGQLYTGEIKKAMWYIAGSFLIIPYFISFEDAQRTVSFRNFQHTIDYCKERLRLSEISPDGKKESKNLKLPTK